MNTFWAIKRKQSGYCGYNKIQVYNLMNYYLNFRLRVDELSELSHLSSISQCSFRSDCSSPNEVVVQLSVGS